MGRGISMKRRVRRYGGLTEGIWRKGGGSVEGRREWVGWDGGVGEGGALH